MHNQLNAFGDEKIVVHYYHDCTTMYGTDYLSTPYMEKLSFPTNRMNQFQEFFHSEDDKMTAATAFIFILKRLFKRFDELKKHTSVNAYLAALKMSGPRAFLYSDCALVSINFDTVNAPQLVMSFFFKMDQEEENTLNTMLLSTGLFYELNDNVKFNNIPTELDTDLVKLVDDFNKYICVIDEWKPRLAPNK